MIHRNKTYAPKKRSEYNGLPDSPRQRKNFDRELELPRLIGLWPSELKDYSAEGTIKIIALISKALRIERQRSARRDWAYELNRHLALHEALKAETARLHDLRRA